MSALCCLGDGKLADVCMHGGYGDVPQDCKLLEAEWGAFAAEAEAGYDPQALTPRPFPPPMVEGSVEDEGWWVTFPDWLRKDVDRLKGQWHALAGGPWGNLRGFQFVTQWPTVDERYTFDPVTGEWDR